MSDSKIFLDSNVLLYLQSADATKADRVEHLIHEGCVISVQVLNEITSVMHRKFRRPWVEIHEFLSIIESLFSIHPVCIEVHRHGRRLADRYLLNFFDALIVASAIHSKCEILYSEDMQDGLIIDGRLAIQNPFSAH